jgi:hypothetical protein
MVQKIAPTIAKVLFLLILNIQTTNRLDDRSVFFDFFQYTKENYPQNYIKNKNLAIERFMKNISMVESSGGKNTRHKKIKYGMHKGHRAIGKYGLMPFTVIEIIKRKKDKNLYKYLKTDYIYKYLEKNNKDYEKIARYLANFLYEKHKGNEKKMAYCWNYGHNIEKHFFVKNNLYKKTDYVKKYVFYKINNENNYHEKQI